MSRSKIDEMRSMVKRAEKAEAKLTRREIENIENGRKAREVLKMIETKVDHVLDAIAEAYANAPSEKVDSILAKTVEDLRSLSDDNSSEKEAKPRQKSVSAASVSEEKAAPTAKEITQPVVNNIRTDMVPQPTGFDPNAGYNPKNSSAVQAGGIQYTAQ